MPPGLRLGCRLDPRSIANGGRRVFLDACCPRPADIAIDVVVGPEFIAGSTRLKAGTAQKLTTLAMVRSHNTYGNRMVDVRATNAKLVARAFSLVQDVTGAPPPRSRRRSMPRTAR